MKKMTNTIKLIALDLDGTLLNSRKELTPRTLRALERAAERGIEIVPSTGRFFKAMPEVIRQLPFIHYAITINGAQVYDIRKECPVAQAGIPYQQAVEIMSYLDTLPVIYDCYMNDWGWMTRSMQERAADFAPDEHYLKMLREVRSPVEDLKAYVLEQKTEVQKVQFFTWDMALREELLAHMDERFENIIVASSIQNNVEINNKDAHKGVALQRLAEYLNIPMEETMAFGDGLNDFSMLQTAGLGVAMANGHPTVKAAAKAVTLSCDEEGVAAGIEKYCLDL